MARPGQRKPAVGDRLSDCISIGVLTKTFPPELVDRVINDAGRREQRVRLLPARVVVYFTLAMCLFSHESYVEVMALLVKGLEWVRQWSPSWTEPSDAAIANARRRLGAEPMKALFEAAAKPLATKRTKGAWFKQWRLVAIDGTTLDLADTPENEKAFGRPGSSGKLPAAFPQARVLGLVECSTHAIVGAEIAPYKTQEIELAWDLVESLKPEMLVLCDRGFWSFDLWSKASATGAQLLWRTKKDVVLPVTKMLDDGSYLSTIKSSKTRSGPKPSVTVRVIEYRLEGLSNENYRVVTTILDHKAAPAKSLGALYGQRWEIETAFDELKTHQRGRAAVLRSKYPETVEQEIWAHLLVHYAVRSLMADVATEHDIDPDRTSFLSALRIIRRQLTEPAAFSPQ